jgi:hypothetical protein
MSHACPVCSSDDVLDGFHRQPVRELFDIKSQELRLSLCRRCGFVFQDPLLPSLENPKHYEDHSSYVTLPTAQIQNAKRDQFAWIASTVESTGFAGLMQTKAQSPGMYEIGPSVGALLAVAKAAGWRVGGLEPSAAAVQVAAESYEIAIATGNLRAATRIDLPVITMVHVLEHVPDPVAALAHLNQIAPASCLLAIEVPDFSVPKNAGGSGYFVPEHVNYFTAGTLVRAATAAGWTTTDVHVHEYASDAGEFCLYPVLRGVFLKLDPADLVALRMMARDRVGTYLDAQARDLRDKLRTFGAQQASLVLFGGGWHTQMLLDVMRPEERAKVRVIVDSNPARTGSKISGIEIDHAKNLPRYRESGIVVSSQGYQEQIVKQIRATIGDGASILTFY